ncbi:unnamed protein product [Paramecium octaurelia]|uniref:Glutaredoxin domain-containing protein n=1 Tax=Paramecium octaurelia TaxID=43137 RepID=A0A8S1XHQ4_PAROT|nr:unnamed protein product [Paramecium octaurelia]
MEHSEIKSDKPVVIYGGDYCPYCHKLKRFLETKNIPYEYRDITKEKEHEKQVNEFVVKLKWSTIPMVFIKQKFVGGYTDVVNLDQKGELENLIK